MEIWYLIIILFSGKLQPPNLHKESVHLKQDHLPKGAKIPFALPVYLANPWKARIEAFVGRKLQPKVVLVHRLAVEVYLIPAQVKGTSTLSLIVDFLPEIMNPETRQVIQGSLDSGKRIAIMTGRGRPVRMVSGTALKQDETPRAIEVAQIYAPELARIARLTGTYIHFHLGDDQATPPYPEEEGTLHLLAGASPPGELETHLLTHVCGVRIEEKMSAVVCRKPVPGRGIILHDADGNPVVQLIGNTAYLLVPVVGHFHGAKSVELFRELLEIIWTALLARRKKKLRPHPKRRGAQAFIKDLTDHANTMPDHLADRTRELEKEIASTLDLVRRLMAERADLTATREALLNGRCAMVIKRLPLDYKRIRAHKSVRDIYTCDSGLQVDTHVITIVEEGTGHRYPIGRFTIRIGEEGAVSIWPIETRHPERVPHPHISKHGTPCFGNGTQAIISAGAEMRYADGIELILRWLTEGYLPESAEHKLAEWPREEVDHG